MAYRARLASVFSVLAVTSAAAEPPDSREYLASTRVPPPALRAEHLRRIDDLLAGLSLREKVGQMTQLDLDLVTTGKGRDVRLDPAKVQKVVVEYGVGSILNVNDEAMPVGRWREIVRGLQEAAARTPHRVPVMYGVDSVHGANYVAGAELFPQPLGLAATWNPALVERASAAAAAETRAAGLPWNFSPVVDLGRQPLWPRLYETYGEDVHLASVMGAATVRGYQGDDPSAPDRVGACLKHYVGYGVPVSGRDRDPAVIPEPALRELHLPPFAAGIAAGALSVMVNSGEVNGVPVHVDGRLLKDVLRGELGFDGVVVSDWEDVKKLVDVHRVARDEKDATRQAVLAGIDMSMVPSDLSFPDLLMRLVEEGQVPRARIDEAVRRILVMKARLGLFDDPLRGFAAPEAVGGEATRQLALQAARESITLLKNEGGALPLAAGARVLVTGPTCDSLPALNNGWSLSWQGDRDRLYPKDRPTILAALRAALGEPRVTSVRGATFDREVDVAAAVAAARRVDAAVVCLGEMPYAETPGNIDDLDLPYAQVRLAREVAATGTPTIVVLVQGRPRGIRHLVPDVDALVMAYNPGHEGGRAIADVLTGAVNPAGRLPVTYPAAPNALATYDHRRTEERDTRFGMKGFRPQFPFGHGLSYTTFAYEDLSVTPRHTARDGTVEVGVTVRNTGSRGGDEVVLLYLSDLVASLTPPVKRLKRFVKVHLAAGASQRVTFSLDAGDFAFVGADGRPLVEPGDFEVEVAGRTARFALR